MQSSLATNDQSCLLSCGGRARQSLRSRAAVARLRCRFCRPESTHCSAVPSGVVVRGKATVAADVPGAGWDVVLTRRSAAEAEISSPRGFKTRRRNARRLATDEARGADGRTNHRRGLLGKSALLLRFTAIFASCSFPAHLLLDFDCGGKVVPAARTPDCRPERETGRLGL